MAAYEFLSDNVDFATISGRTEFVAGMGRDIPQEIMDRFGFGAFPLSDRAIRDLAEIRSKCVSKSPRGMPRCIRVVVNKNNSITRVIALKDDYFDTISVLKKGGA